MARIDDVLARLADAKQTGPQQWQARCPLPTHANGDRRPSLSVGVGDNGAVLLLCHRCGPAATADILAALGLTLADLAGGDGRPPKRRGGDGQAAPDFGAMAQRYAAALTDAELTRVAGELGVSPEALRRLGAGWDGEALTFPERDASGRVVGIFRRLPDGRKLSATGGKRGLTIPANLPIDGPLLVTEGMSDCAALLSLGFAAIGRPSCATAARLVADFARGRDAVIVGDGDDTGRRGAAALADTLVSKCAAVRVIFPPDGLKDAREWLRAGATAANVQAAIEAAEPWQRRAAPTAGDECATPRPWEPFPLDALPEPLRGFIGEGAAALGADPAMVALPTLAAAAACVGTKRRIRLKCSWGEPCIVWAVVVSESGTLKSPSLDLALAPLRQAQAEAFHRHESQLAEYERAVILYESELSVWRKTRQGEPPDKPERPEAVRYLVSDITVESVASILLSNPAGVLLARDELSGWFGSFNQYKQGRGSDVANWLETYRGGPVTVDRKSAKTIYVPSAAVGVVGTIQPGALRRSLTPEYLECGLAARVLLARPPERRKRWTEAVPRAATVEAYRLTLDALRELRFGTGADGRSEAVEVPLSPDGKAAWVRFYNDFAEWQAGAGDSALRSALSKLEAYAGRFGLLFHLIRAASGEPLDDGVDAASVEAGAALTRWFAREAERVYGELSETDAEREQRELVTFIRSRGGVVSVRDLQRGPRRFRGPADEAERALDELVRAGLGGWEHPSPGAAGGHPATMFRLANPGGDGDRTPGCTPETEVVSLSPLSPPIETRPADDGLEAEERAAIMEYDGGLTREQADALLNPGDSGDSDGTRTDAPESGVVSPAEPVSSVSMTSPTLPAVGQKPGAAATDGVEPHVPAGWTADGWCHELRRRAGLCGADDGNHEAAQRFRAWADAVERRYSKGDGR